MAKHSELSASSCERWWNCPGSVAACRGIKSETSKYAAEGTVAHSLAEAWLSKGVKAWEKLGDTVMQEGFEIEVTEEMCEAVEEYVDYVQKRIEEAGPSAIVLFEYRVELTEVNAKLFGTADTVIIVPFVRIETFDLKYGKGKRVSAYQNKQFLYYTLGVALKEDVSNFILHCCQPRVEDGFTTFEGTADMLQEFQFELEEKVEAALKPDAPLVPGDHCRNTFCPRRHDCPALQTLSRELTVRDFDDPVPVSELTLEQIQKVLRYEDTIKDWMGSVREHAKELMLQGMDIPGFKVVESKSHAQWTDTDAIIAEFGDEFGDALFEKKLLTPAKFEKLVGKKRLGKDFRDNYTVRNVTGFRVVEEDAKGEPVKQLNVKEAFNDD